MEDNCKSININQHCLNIYHNSSYGYAGLIWECAYIFSSFISSDKAKKYFKNKTVLEVGSGTGICGLIAACLDTKKVYLTDRSDNLKLLETNYELNKNIISNNCEIYIRSLDWNYITDFNKIKENFDIIIAPDIIYHGVNYNSILSLLDYFSSKNTEIILGYNHRINSSYEFFNNLEADDKWEVKKLHQNYIEEEYRNDYIILVLIKKIK